MKNFITIVFCSITTLAIAQSLPADRPGQTMNATTLQGGLWQVQTGGIFGGFVDNDNGEAFDSWGFPLDIRYGISDRFEFMVSGEASFAATQGTGSGIEYGLMSFGGGFRFNLFDGTEFGSMALYGGYQHQSYEGGIAAADNFIGKVLYKLPLGKKLQFATNLGYTQSEYNQLDYEEGSGGRFTYTAALSFNTSDKFGLFLEAYGDAGTANSSWVDGGIYYLPNPRVQWDLILGNGGVGDYSQYFFTIGVCFQIGEPR